MNTFITKQDYDQAISNNILDAVTKFDDNKLEVAEDAAVELMCGYLNSRYDTAAIFSATGAARNPVVLMHALAIVVYQLHASINPRKTPEHRSQRYQAAITWLEQVAACNINPPSLPKIIDGTRDYFLFGSRTKRNNDLD